MTYVNKEAVDWVFERTIKTPNDKLVLLVIARRANKHWAAFPSKRELARVTGLAEATIDKSIRRLDADGHLARIPFIATNGQDQRPGFVLAGGGRLPDGLDAEFLAVAFADRKQAGEPLVMKPQHWSGENGREGGASASLGGGRYSPPEGGASATPRRKENKEERRGQEDSAVAQAPNEFEAPSKSAAIAEVCAAAPTPNRGSSKPEAAKIPKQRTPRPSNEKRDANWRAQIITADVDELEGAAGSMSAGNGHYDWACRQASFRLGFGTGGEVPDKLYPQFVRHMYLYLLKDVAATDEGHLAELKYPLDERIEAAPTPRKWDHTEHVPAGETAASFGARMVQVAASMAPEQLGPWAAEIEDFLPGLWYQKRQEAREQVRTQGLPLEIETIASVAVRLMIQHYTDKPQPKWPAEVVPPSMRTVASISEAPPWAA